MAINSALGRNDLNKTSYVIDAGTGAGKAVVPTSVPALVVPTPANANAGAQTPTAVDPNKKKGLSEKDYFSISNYSQKKGMPVRTDISYTTNPTVPVSATEETAPVSTGAAADEDDIDKRTIGLSNPDANPNWTNIDTPSRAAQAPFNGRNMDNALGQLQAAYARNMGTYTPKTEEEIQRQAAADYQSYYDQLRTAAGNEYAMNDLALQQQIAGLQRGYDKSREASAREYANAYSQTDRNLLSRGMQRSSYGAQTLSNVALKGAEAQQAIWDAQLEQEANLGAQRRQLAGNYAATLQGYDAGQASDVMSRVWDLRDTEYDRNVTRANTLNQLATQLYGYLNQINEQDREQYNTDRTMSESQHQFDVGVAQSRQAVEDARTQYAASLAEQMRQYNNSANMQEMAFRAQYPTMGFTRGEDGRLILDQTPDSRRFMTQQYAELEAAYQEALKRPVNVTVQNGGIDYGQWAAEQKSKQLVAEKNGTANTSAGTPTSTTYNNNAYRAMMNGLGMMGQSAQGSGTGTGAPAETVYKPVSEKLQ